MAARVPPVRDADADRLAALIRAPSSLAHWVRGPLVVLDGEHGAVKTLCGAGASAEAASIGDQLVDATRADPHCQVEVDRVFCTQRGAFAGDRTLGLYFERDGGWHVSAIVITREGAAVPSAEVDAFSRETQTASCPAE